MMKRFLSAVFGQQPNNMLQKQPQQLTDASLPTQSTFSPVSDRVKAFGLASLVGLSGSFWLASESFISRTTNAAPIASVGRAVAFTCNDSEATIKAKGGPVVRFGTASIYIGYQQVSSINKDPRMIRFDNGRRTWCKSDYEVTGDDGSGYGLIWDGGSMLYGVFGANGTQGTSSQDFRRFATSGWLTSYGQGGGRRVAILARINPATGTIANATYLSGQLSNGDSNSITATGLSWTGSSLIVKANAWYSPRRTNKTRMSCSGTAPFSYTIQFAANLGSASKASAVNCQ